MSQLLNLYPKDNFDFFGDAGYTGSYTDVSDGNDGTRFRQIWNNVVTTTGRCNSHVTAPPNSISIQSVAVFYRASFEGGGPEPMISPNPYPTATPVVRPGGGTAYLGTGFTMADVDYINTNQNNGKGGCPSGTKSFLWNTDPSTGLAWLLNGVQNLVAGVDTTAPAIGTVANLATAVCDWWVQLAYTPLAAVLEPVRALGSLELRLFSRAIVTVDFDVDWRFGNYEIGDWLWLETPFGPGAKGDGWKPSLWSARPLLVIGHTVPADGKTIHYTCLDLHEQAFSWWESSITTVGWTPEGQGVARADMGGGFTITRNEVAYVFREDGLIDSPAANALKYSKDGVILESEPTICPLHQTVFANLTGSWSLFATDTGSNIAADTNDFLFDVAGLRQSLLMVGATTTDSAGAGATGNRISYQNGFISGHLGFGAVVGGVEVPMPQGYMFRVTLNYVNNTSAAGHFLEYRVVTEGGVELQTWTRIPVNTTKGARDWASPMITQTQAATCLQLEFRIRGTGNPTAHLYSAQILQVAGRETVGIPASIGTWRVHLTGNATARVPDVHVVPNPLTARMADPTKGIYHMRYFPYFDHTDLNDGERRIFWLALYTGRTFHDLFYYLRVNPTTGQLRLSRRIPNLEGGLYTPYDAIKPFVISAGVAFDVGVRWTGAIGELDLPPYSLDVLAAAAGVLLVAGTRVQYQPDQSFPVLWTNVVNCSNALNTLRKNAGATGTWNAGASSTQTITAGDGFVEWTVETVTDVVAAGLSNSDPDQNFTSIKHCAYNDGTGVFKAYESGVLKFTSAAGVVKSGSRIRVAVEGVNVRYYVDGVEQYVDSRTPSYPMLADCSMFNTSNAVKQVVLYGPNVSGSVGQDEPWEVDYGGTVQWPGK